MHSSICCIEFVASCHDNSGVVITKLPRHFDELVLGAGCLVVSELNTCCEQVVAWLIGYIDLSAYV